MGLKTGLNQTEVGVIPEEWNVAPLGQEVEQLEAGVSVNSVDEELRCYAHDQSILKTSAVSSGQFLPLECKKIAPWDLSRAKLNPRADTIIISRMNTPDLVGECGYVESDYPNLFLPDRLWMTRIRNNSNLCVRWLNYLFSSQPYKTRIKGIATGTSGSMKNIAKDALLTMPIAYPDPTEQHAIAGALGDMDGLLEGLEKLIAKKRDLKQAAMQQLLTVQTRLPRFSGKWVPRKLRSIVCDFVVPMRDKPKRFSGDIPWCRIEDFDGKYLIGSRSGQYVDEDTVREMNLKIFPAGTLLVSCSADLGRCAIVGQPLVTNQTFIGLVLDESVTSNEFMYYYMSSKAMELNILSSGTTISYLSREQFENFPVLIPSMKGEQTAIAAVLSDMDTELAALEQRFEKTRALKQGMMQELLTGKIRLV